MKSKIKRLISFWNEWNDDVGAQEDARPIARPIDDYAETPLELTADLLRRDASRTRLALRRFLRLCVQLTLASLLGVLTGFVGAGFLGMMNWASAWFLESEKAAASGAFRAFLLLPLAGLFIVLIYRLAKTSVDAGTNQVIESLVSDKKPSLALAPLIFISAVVTQAFGGSAGREGAAIQLGGCVGLGVGRILRLRDSGLRTAIYCGMAGGFSAILGAPLTAAVFAIEVGCVGVVYYPAFLPSLVSSAVASSVTRSLGFAPFFHAQPVFPATSPDFIIRALALGLLCGLTSVFYCASIRRTTASMARRFSNDYYRVVFGACIVIVATTLLGTNAYNGSGILLVERATQGEALPWDFVCKVLFTAVTLGAGFKGGEIVPALAVGSTFGCWAGSLLGLDPALGASLGMIAVFCGSTNCPIASLILGIEFFGAQNALLFALVCAATFMASGRAGLYKSQRLVFSKASDQVYDERLKSRLQNDLLTLDRREKTVKNADISQLKNRGKNCTEFEEYLFSEKSEM